MKHQIAVGAILCFSGAALVIHAPVAGIGLIWAGLLMILSTAVS